MNFPPDENSLVFLVGSVETRVLFMDRARLLIPEKSGSFLTVFDQNTASLFPDFTGNRLVLPPGEGEKSFSSVEQILSAALDAGLARDSDFMGAGGGVICDMTAFAASLYMRGAGLILVPTTLLAMIDASLGGKSGVDFRGYKNMAGTFYPARELRICPEILTSLPEREYRNGLAEVIKHGLLKKSDFLSFLTERREGILKRDPRFLTRLIRDSLAVKGEFVEKDFKEQGERAFLNLGHTFGHALESVSSFSTWSHGEAVAWGIGRALEAGTLMGITSPAYAKKAADLLEAYGFDLSVPPLDTQQFIAAMGRDKKKRAGAVRFVLQRDWGETLQTEIPEEILRRVLVP